MTKHNGHVARGCAALRGAFLFTAMLALAGCATWHEDLMTNQQLVQADCKALAQEDAKLAENVKHASQASSGGGFAAVMVAVLEGMAGTGGESAGQQARLAEDAAAKARSAEERRQRVRMVQAKKGCV
jgi:hypothetical protein